MSDPAHERSILVDAHGHFHDCFDTASYLDRINDNIRSAARRMNIAGDHCVACVLLADTTGQDTTARFASAAINGRIGEWSVSETRERGSLLMQRDDISKLLLIHGRQIVCSERLEVLALACEREFLDGQPLGQTLREVCESGAIAVLPWGFGKWWFRRGELMVDLLKSLQTKESCADQVFVGDNGGRARVIPRGRVFALARNLGFRNLPGSDPLPMPSHCDRVGSYGFVVSGKFDLTSPARSLKAILKLDTVQPEVFGYPQGIADFAKNQLAMQLKKRWPG